MRRLIYPKVTGKQLVQYASNAAGIPPATMQACIEAIVQAIYYYAIRGMRVTFPEFGGFYLQVRSKTAKTEDGISADSFTYTGLAFQPLGDLRKLISDTNVVVQTAVYSNQAEGKKTQP
jgi:nucleoid DNA-binding protein